MYEYQIQLLRDSAQNSLRLFFPYIFRDHFRLLVVIPPKFGGHLLLWDSLRNDDIYPLPDYMCQVLRESYLCAPDTVAPRVTYMECHQQGLNECVIFTLQNTELLYVDPYGLWEKHAADPTQIKTSPLVQGSSDFVTQMRQNLNDFVGTVSEQMRYTVQFIDNGLGMFLYPQ